MDVGLKRLCHVAGPVAGFGFGVESGLDESGGGGGVGREIK